MTIQYDFKDWVSIPSSVKLVSEKTDWPARIVLVEGLPVVSGRPIEVEFKAKQEGVLEEHSMFVIHRWAEDTWKWGGQITTPLGTYDWQKIKGELSITDTTAIHVAFWGGKGITWFDDLRIFQDDKLIYDNYFSAIRPGKLVPVMYPLPEKIIGAWQRRKAGEVAILQRPMLGALIQR